MRHCAAGLMVPDQTHALFLGIGAQHGDVEILGRLGEIHVPAVAEPVAVPAHIPPFDQQVRNAIGCGKVDVAFHIFIGRAMLGSARPAPFALDHVPPHAGELARLEPAHVTQLVGLVQVQHEVAVVNPRRVIGDDQCAPGCRPRTLFLHFGFARPWGQVGAQRVALGPRHSHARIINERGFVQRNMRAIGQFHRDRGGSGADRRQRRFVVKILLAVPQIGGFPPRRGFAREGKFGQLVGDFGGRHVRLVWEFVSETDTVIIDAKRYGHDARQRGRFLQMHLQFAVMVADCCPFTPRLRPAFIEIANLLSSHRQTALQLHHIGEQEAQPRRVEDGLATPADVINGAAIAIDGQCHAHSAIRRCRRNGRTALSDCRHSGKRETGTKRRANNRHLTYSPRSGSHHRAASGRRWPH